MGNSPGYRSSTTARLIMKPFTRIAAYAFLILTGLYAFSAYETGWRPITGLIMAILCTVRIIIMSRQATKPAEKAHDTQQSHNK